MDALEKKKKKTMRRWNVPMITLMVLFVLIALPNLKEGSYFGLYGLLALFITYFMGKVLIGMRMEKWRTCPNCQQPDGDIVKSTVIVEPTLNEDGKGIHKIRCKKCGHEWEEEYEIPCLVQSSSDDDDDDSSSGGGGWSHSSSGSWGGGSSSGGGAGRSFCPFSDN